MADNKKKYTYMDMSFEKAVVSIEMKQRFSNAVKKLSVTKSEVIRRAISECIIKAENNAIK
jgi:predicted DNA-binding protein